jgi:hypothetical protein
MMLKIFSFFLLFTSFAYAQYTPFTLSGIKEVYPVVEIHTEYVPQEYVGIIKNKIVKTMSSLGINTKNFSDRSVAVLITGMSVDDLPVLHVKFIIGEEVKRLDGTDTFAMTYANDDIFEVTKLDEDLNESIDNMLERFSKQYKEDNQ